MRHAGGGLDDAGARGFCRRGGRGPGGGGGGAATGAAGAGTVAGAAAGAGAGRLLFGNSTTGMLIGGAAGGLAGNMTLDRPAEDRRRQEQVQNQRTSQQ